MLDLDDVRSELGLFGKLNVGYGSLRRKGSTPPRLSPRGPARDRRIERTRLRQSRS